MTRRQYDDEENIQDEHFGRRRNDRIGILELFDLLTGVMQELSEIKQIINNGMSDKISENTEIIKENSKAIKQLQECVLEDDAYQKGRIKTWHLAIALVSAVGGGIVSTLTILTLLGLL